MHRAPSALTLTVRLPMGGLLVNVAGDLDLSTSQKLVQFTTNQIRPSTSVVTLDLAQLGSCDQEGASALLQILGVCERDGRQLRLVRLQPQVREVLERTGISGHLCVDQGQ
jgi:anti-anti-sigma factor